ncbi:cyclopropane fatty acyl phospholipid synthase [Xanthovirga aplysinae]|uniref:cyclopropane fatty acyl phospholipid synthase n=1 Tax=Xanthovirga aplysinae TaxID=2529853 RepID=UPI0012BC7BD8|nr:cyclopropane fatty acyl phospholipid synthase [Xanthovirga aplysinae]MTI31559.1 cyclopropane fatty acyl phospholipid synthase [Xanthovirga aplysinae]
MSVSTAKAALERLLAPADVEINGDRPWDIKVNDVRVYQRVLTKGSLAVGESYMDGWWECDKLEELITRVFRLQIDRKFRFKWADVRLYFRELLFNMQSPKRSKKVILEHYDLGNDLFFTFLDPYRQYTCAYFKDTEDLGKAQINKLELICKKLYLKPGDKVLDIGCGFGGLAKFMSEHYGCEVTGVSISKEQLSFAKDFCKGLPVNFVNRDYRHFIEYGKFDKIVSVGMFEAVGFKNFRQFMEVVEKNLKENGLFLLHTMGSPITMKSIEPWVDKYIFPNGMLPSISQIGKAIEGLFVMEDWHNFGYYYYKTLMAWFKNFESNWHMIKGKYDQRFYRMWKFYLLSFAAIFQSRKDQLWQIVLSKRGVEGGYKSFR